MLVCLKRANRSVLSRYARKTKIEPFPDNDITSGMQFCGMFDEAESHFFGVAVGGMKPDILHRLFWIMYLQTKDYYSV